MKTFKDILSVIITMIVLFVTAALCIACFFPLFQSFNLFTLGCGVLAALIPGTFCYGLASALTEFLGYPQRSATITLLAIIFGILIIVGVVVMLIF